MKDIKEYIVNESWEFLDDINSNSGMEINVPNKAKYLMINTETEIISAVTDKDLDSFEKDYDDEKTAIAVKKLKVGESYDADGGITIYIRIKK